MNITLRCRGSKREQARPPICAARRRAHRRAGCRGDQTNAALNARVRPNRQHVYRCRGSCSCRPYQTGAPPPRRTAGIFFSVSWASWASITSPSNAPSSLSKVDAVERKPRAQWSPPVQVSQPMIRSAFFSVLSDIGTPSSLDVQQIADQRHRDRVFSASVCEAQQSCPPKSSQPPAFRVRGRVRFRSRAIVETGTASGVPCCREPPALFFLANTARQLVGISVGIGSNRRSKLCQIQMVMVLSVAGQGHHASGYGGVTTERQAGWVR